MAIPATGGTARVAVIGGGPAGLMAAEAMAAQGIAVTVYDAMPSVGRKFLLAGKGGMNITHAEPLEAFLGRYRERETALAPMIAAFPPDALRAWMQSLGVDSFVGSSGRVFPAEMKAAPLLRAWLRRLRERGVVFRTRHRWTGWQREGGRLHLAFATPSPEAGEPNASIDEIKGKEETRFDTIVDTVDAVVLALGGGSWSRLGSDGAWVPLLAAHGIAVAPLRPANCGFDIGWSDFFRARFAGQPLKSVALRTVDVGGTEHLRRGECLITATGIEGGGIYALSAPLRDAIAAHGEALLEIDLAPDKPLSRLIAEIDHPRGSRSMASHLQSRAGIAGVRAGLLREVLPREVFDDARRLAQAIKALPLRLLAPRPLDEAISSAGGVRFEALQPDLMLRDVPGMFCAGEMVDWEAPTGGYLLTACFASGRMAGEGVCRWLATPR